MNRISDRLESGLDRAALIIWQTMMERDDSWAYWRCYGPHGVTLPIEECPTYYDGCNCTPEALLIVLDDAEKERDEYKLQWQLRNDQIEDISAIIANLDSTPEAGDEPFTPDSVIGRIYKIIDMEVVE